MKISKLKIKSSKVTLVGPCKLEKRTPQHEGFFIFIDGGQEHRMKNFKSTKDYICVGDQDSTRLPVDILLKQKKDFSDLAFALTLVPKAATQVYCEGLFPRLKDEPRFDHLLANLGEIYEFVKKRKIRVQLNSKMRIIPAGKNSLMLKGIFSVFSLEPIQLSLAGRVKYKLSNQKIPLMSSKTLSNFGSGQVSFKNSKPCLVIVK